MKKEFAGTILTSFGIGDTNQFLEGARGKCVLVTVGIQEVAD